MNLTPLLDHFNIGLGFLMAKLVDHSHRRRLRRVVEGRHGFGLIMILFIDRLGPFQSRRLVVLKGILQL